MQSLCAEKEELKDFLTAVREESSCLMQRHLEKLKNVQWDNEVS